MPRSPEQKESPLNKQVIIVVVAAIVLFGVALVGALAFTGKSNSGGNGHTMPDGQTMATPMRTMDNGDTMTGMTMP